MNKIKIMETCLRDGHQSLMATRLTTAEMLPIIEKLDNVGYHSLEMWGGATFDAALRFLNEDPWERLREIKKRVKNTKLQMLLRGQNLLGYRNYPDDIVERFVKKSIQNGIDIVRIFDALNDVRNLQTACEATKKYGGHAQLAMSYTISPVHTIEYFKNLALEMQEIGADSIAIKDMSGILLPEVAYKLVKELKSVLRVPVEVHTHATAGLASMTYIKAVEAGADIIDTAISPLSGGTSQPATESIVRAFQGTERETGFDLELLKEIAEYFKPIRAKYLQEGILNPQALMTEPSIVEYQLPGGMLSNFLSQLKMQKAENRYEDVLREIPRVRKDLGYPPLVTPLSQMVGTQAIFNILTGQRYKLIPNEIKNYVRGLYGKMKMNNKKVAKLATKALLYEVTISPKAGLVSRLSNGSHRDMDFYTFIDSALSLSKYFSECFIYGQENDFYSPNFFKNLRDLGKKAEKEMYEATNGINTHKGTIFSMGILISVLAGYLKEVDEIDLKVLSEKIKNMCSPLLNELESTNNFSTYGEKAYKKYHLTGARGLALSGYDIVLLDGINKLKEFTKILDFETSCILLLFYYISILDDTNIVNRANFKTLKEIQMLCKKLYEENIKSLSKEKIKNEMSNLNDIFIEKNISAGGSADLLILTIFIYLIKL